MIKDIFSSIINLQDSLVHEVFTSAVPKVDADNSSLYLEDISIRIIINENEKNVFVIIYDARVKNIILPGKIRDIMSTVLIAEKRAQANVITRREEVASTKSLLNKVKIMDENSTLYKLKELEYLEKICNNVGNISVGAVLTYWHSFQTL